MSDMYFANVAALLHGNGTNGGTTITDSGPNAITVTNGNSTTTSTTQIKFGTASLKFVHASTQYLNLGDIANLQMGTGDFTIEAWVYLNTNGNIDRAFWNKSHGDLFSMYFTNSATGQIDFYLNNVRVCRSSTALSTGTWYFIAVTRASSVCQIWVNGVADGASGTSAFNCSVSGTNFEVGTSISTAPDCYMHDFRVTKGVARYSTTFAVPTAELPDNTANGATLAVTEAKDTAAITGNVATAGNLIVTEATDTAALGMTIINRATLVVTETPDVLAIAGNDADILAISFALTEITDNYSGIINIFPTAVANISAVESPDIFAAIGAGPAPPNPVYVAVGTGGGILKSGDGYTWNLVTNTITVPMMDVYQGGSGGVWVSVGSAGQIWTAPPNASAWTNRFSPVATILNSVFYNGSYWVAVGASGRILYSLDGLSWGLVFTATADLQGVSYANGMWVAVGNSGRLYTSTNGIAWTLRTTPTPTATFNGVFYGNGTWVVCTNGKFLTSTTGLVWTAVTSPDATAKNDIYFDGTTWITSGAPYITTTSKSTVSTTTSSWTTRNLPVISGVYYDIVYTGSLWIQVGYRVISGVTHSSILTSPNGSSWTEVATSFTYQLRGVSAGYDAVIDYASGVLAVSELPDTMTIQGFVAGTTTAVLTVTETADYAVIHGFSNGTLGSTLIVTETPDTAAIFGTEVIADNDGNLVTTESPDVLYMAMSTFNFSIFVTMEVTESPDTMLIDLSSPISGTLTVTEAPDVLAFSDTVVGGNAVTIAILPASFDLIVTYGASLFDGGTLNIYSGNQPILPSDPATGTLLGSINLPNPAFTEAVDGTASIAGVWSANAADSGVCGWFRLLSSDGLNSIDGSISTGAGTGNMLMTVQSVAVGDPLEVVTANFQFIQE